MRRVDIAGQRFGMLTVIRFSGKTEGNRKRLLWLCVCDCGREVDSRGEDLRSGNTKSCGCQQYVAFRQASVTHGACIGGKSPEYLAYIRAKGRCTNKNRDNYKYYGGNTPPVLFKFNSFEEWLEELGPCPSPGMTPDRKNPWGNYEKGNVAWATQLQQARNKRRSVCQQ